jgi:hypothetical protein
MHLAPARRITIVTSDGKHELDGPQVTADQIQNVIAPVVPPSQREALSSGHAEWTVRHRELGRIRVVAVTGRWCVI